MSGASGPAALAEPVVELSDVSKDYRGLRPLRMASLIIRAGEQIALSGLDEPMAEVFVNLLTGATVPDRGEVRIFGRPTTAIETSSEWLTVVDRFGIVSHRSALLEGMTVVQNLAMPFTLDVEPPPAEVVARATKLASEAGIGEAAWMRPVAELDAVGRVRLRLARALALDPGILLLEHANAGVARTDVRALGQAIHEIATRRRCASIVVTADEAFAGAASTRALRLQPATGQLVKFHDRERRRWW